MAIEHKNITNADLHEPLGVSSATAGQVYVADGAGSGSWVQQAAAASTVVGVETASDLPTAVADVITLAAGICYQINTDVDIGNDRIVFSAGSEIMGISPHLTSIISTTAGALFTGTSVRMTIKNLTLDASSASEIIKHDGGGTKVLELEGLRCTTHTAVFCESTAALASTISDCLVTGGTDGFVYLGTHASTNLNHVSLTGFTGNGIDLGTAVFDGIFLDFMLVSGTGASDVGLLGAAANANLSATGIARISGVNFNGTTTVLSGITQKDVNYTFTDNSGIQDTNPHGQVYISGNATTTAISTINTPVKIDGGTGYTVEHDEQFTGTTDGRLTYDGLDDVSILALATVSGTGVSSTNTFKIYIAKNGTVVAASGVSREYASTATGVVGITAMIEIVTGDYLEIWVENTTGTIDFDMVDCNLVTKV